MTPLVFGYTCFVQDISPRLDKLSLRFIKRVFVGYFRTQKGYRCYNPSTKKYFVSADVTFFESVLYFSPPVPGTASASIPFLLSVLRGVNGSGSSRIHVISKPEPDKEFGFGLSLRIFSFLSGSGRFRILNRCIQVLMRVNF